MSHIEKPAIMIATKAILYDKLNTFDSTKPYLQSKIYQHAIIFSNPQLFQLLTK